MKSSILSLAFISAVAFGAAPHDAVAKDINDKIARMSCPTIKSPPKKRWGWESSYLVAKISKDYVQTIPDENADKKLPIGSITKLMTAYLVLQEIERGQLIKPETRINITPSSVSLIDSCFAIKILPKDLETISVQDALTHLLYLSSNPMAENLAVAVAGSQEKFVEQMNAQAKEWGMNNTHFINVHGLPVGDRKSEYTTANDLLILSRKILPFIDKYKYYEGLSIAVDGVLVPINNTKRNKLKQQLISKGHFFKTATIDECNSMINFAEIRSEPGYIVTIRLCGKEKDQFSVAEKFIDTARNHIPELIYSAQAAETQEMQTQLISPQ